jgi:hypothetical protein
MSGGGAGGSGTQKFEWNDAIAPHWADALSWGSALKDPSGFGAYKPYPGQRIAGFDDDQSKAMDDIRWYADNPEGFLYGQGNNQLQKTVGDDYLTGQGANPFVSQNQYEGENPYFNSVVKRGMGNIADTYKEATAPQERANAVMMGTLGGGDYQRSVAKNEEALAKQLSDYDSQMRSGQYDRSANLYENYLQRGSGAFEGERGRQMGAAGMSQADQGLTLERAKARMGVGDIERGMTQDYLNQYFGDWQDQNNQQYKMLDFYSGLLGRAQGGMSPNMTTTQPGYSASPFSQLLGTGLLAYGAMK